MLQRVITDMSNAINCVVPLYNSLEVIAMGRKRTSAKRDVKLKVDEALLDKLIELKINKSALFTDAALKKLEELEEKKKKGLD